MQRREFPQGVAAHSISLRIGHPDPTTLITPEFKDAVARVLASPQAYQALEYGAQQGTSGLLDYLLTRINREQSLTLQPDQLMLVAGSTAAVDMIARPHKRAGGVVIVEAPTYADALHVFRDHGLELYSVPMDQDGIIVEALETLLRRLQAESSAPRWLYTIPNFHNPAGVTLNEARRVQIMRLARQYDLTIVEDDVYRDLSFEGAPPASFLALADGVPVLHIGSFSKTLGPGLRLGWLAGPADAIDRYVNCGTYDMSGGASPFAAHIVAEYCRSGDWEAHVASLRQRYKARRDAMLVALDRYMPSGITWTVPAGGFFIWVSLPSHILAQDIVRAASARGVTSTSGEGYFLNPDDGCHKLRLAFSFAPLEDIDTAVKILGDITHSQMTSVS